MEIALLTTIALFATGILAGGLGALLGIGGGIIVVPVLTLIFNVDITVAVASSLVAVVASSTAAGSVYVGKGLAHMRLAMLLEVATTAGGVMGGLAALWLAPNFVSGLFSLLLVITSVLMLRRPPRGKDHEVSPEEDVKPTKKSRRSLQLGGSYYDDFQNRIIHFRIVNIPVGLAVSFVAGTMSGLLGVGGGFIKVPTMNLSMRVPMKVASATSNFMIGVTAISSLFVYFARGYVHPMIAAPVAIGVVGGALIGARMTQLISPFLLKKIFGVLLFFVALQMLLNALGVFRAN